MKRKIIGLSLAGLVCSLAAALPSYAQTAELQIAVNGSGSMPDSVTVTSSGVVTYGGGCSPSVCPTSLQTATAAGILWSGTIDNVTFSDIAGTVVPGVAGITAPKIDLGGLASTSTGAAITLSFSANGFTVGETPSTMNAGGPPPNTGNVTSENFYGYIDNTNTLLGEGSGTLVTSSAGPGLQTGAGPTATPYSMTSVISAVLPAGAMYSPDNSLTVAPYVHVTVVCPTANSGSTGTAYTGNFVASGGEMPYSFSLLSGSLPPGLTLSSSGAITGTPTTAGLYKFAGKVTDASGATATTPSCMIGITQSSSQNPPPTLKVTCPTSTATVGVPYSSSVGVTGGTPPYKYAIVYGSLPAGLTLNTSTGAITGIPTTAGQTGAFKIQVTDSSSPAQVAYTNCSGSCSNGTTVSWGGSGNPQSGWGQKSWTSSYTSNNVNLNVYGWDLHGNHANLYSNNFGGNSYLGISNDQWGGNQIDSQHFVQCDLSDAINKGATGASITLSSTGWGVSYDIYGSNTLGQLGTLLQSNVQVNPWSQSGQSVSVPQFGKYKYVCVKAHSGSNGGVSICNISSSFPCACAIDVGQSSNQGGSGYGGSGYGGSGYGGSGYGGSGSGGSGYGGSGYGGSGSGGSGYGGSGSGGQQGSGSGQCGW